LPGAFVDLYSSVSKVIFLVAPEYPEPTIQPAHYRKYLNQYRVVLTYESLGLRNRKHKKESHNYHKNAHAVIGYAAHADGTFIPFAQRLFFKFFEGHIFYFFSKKNREIFICTVFLKRQITKLIMEVNLPEQT